MQALLAVAAFGVAVVAAVRGLWSPCGLSMVSALNPMAERGRGHRYGPTVAWYVLGAVLGGALLGAGSAALAAAVPALAPGPGARALVASLAALVCWLSDGPVCAWQLPTHPRQVNERWIGGYRRWIYAGGFGVQIGTGFATYVMSATVYLTVALAALTGDARLAFAVGVTFGAVRGLGVLCGAAARTPQRLAAVLGRLDATAESSLLACVCAEIVVAALAMWRAAGPAGPVAAAGLGAALAAVTVARMTSRGWKSDTLV
jgi:hypothetical protein